MQHPTVVLAVFVCVIFVFNASIMFVYVRWLRGVVMTQRCCTMTQRCGAWILATYYTPCVRPSSDRNTHRPDCLEQPQSGLSGTPTDRTVWNTNRPDCLEHPQTILSGTPTDWTVWDTHIPDCLEHSVCGCFRQSGTPTDRTVCNTHRSDCLEHPQTGQFWTPTDRTVWNTHRPDCLEHPDCRCSRQSGTPTDRTVSVRLSTMLQLRRRTSLRGRSDVTRCPLWHPRCLERLRLHLRLYVILAFDIVQHRSPLERHNSI